MSLEISDVGEWIFNTQLFGDSEDSLNALVWSALGRQSREVEKLVAEAELLADSLLKKQ